MNKGFTLTEILIVLVIFILVMGAIYSGYILVQKAYSQSESFAEMNQNGRVILERMVREIRQSRNIKDELPDSLEVPENALNSLEFEDGHIQEHYHYIKYFVDDNKVMREEIKYYFLSDPETFLPWNASSTTETVSSTTIKGPEEIGEHIGELKFWNAPDISIFLKMIKNGKESVLKTKVFGRNL
jgi:prepilin-type N-terminal cleavage/methylation domain-containing protein